MRFLIRSFQPTDLAPPALEEIDRPNTVAFIDNLPTTLTIHIRQVAPARPSKWYGSSSKNAIAIVMLTFCLPGEHSQDPQDVSATLRNFSPARPAKADRLHDENWTKKFEARPGCNDGRWRKLNSKRRTLGQHRFIIRLVFARSWRITAQSGHALDKDAY